MLEEYLGKLGNALGKLAESLAKSRGAHTAVKA
jgi:hypothetical protein